VKGRGKGRQPARAGTRRGGETALNLEKKGNKWTKRGGGKKEKRALKNKKKKGDYIGVWGGDDRGDRIRQRAGEKRKF